MLIMPIEGWEDQSSLLKPRTLMHEELWPEILSETGTSAPQMYIHLLPQLKLMGHSTYLRL